MRIVALVLAALAALKLGVEDYVWRQATREAIFQAYRERAVQACQAERRMKQFGVAPVAWQQPPVDAVTVGQRGVRVALWRIDEPQWADRFKRTTVQLVATDADKALACTFDTKTGVAHLRSV